VKSVQWIGKDLSKEYVLSAEEWWIVNLLRSVVWWVCVWWWWIWWTCMPEI